MKTTKALLSIRHHIVRDAIATAVAGCFAGSVAAQLPTSPQVVSGSANFAQAGSNLTVTNSTNAIINWQTFSIGRSNAVHFEQPAVSSSVLNRVLANDPSLLLGNLSSNGRVFLVNPAGIFVGEGAKLDLAAFAASTLNIRDQDFLAGRMLFEGGLNAGSVQNFGLIKTPTGGSVYLIAPQVENHGVITAPNGEVILAAGHTVELVDTATPGVKVQIAGSGQAVNLGSVLAESGRIGMVGALVQNKGTLAVDSVVREGGRIFLRASQKIEVDAGGRIVANGTKGGEVSLQSADLTLISGAIEAKGSESSGGRIEALGDKVGLFDAATLDASGQTRGGTVLVGGDFQGKNPDIQNASATYVAPDASIHVDAVQAGEGGKIIVWADKTTRFYGHNSARGGVAGGDGGFVEVSGKEYLDYQGITDTSATRGLAGTLLLDPSNVTIVSSSSIPAYGSFTQAAENVFGGASQDVVIGWNTINSQMAYGNVYITTSQSGGGSSYGDITVTADGTLTSTNNLSLIAHRNIDLQASIFGYGGDVSLIAGWDGADPLAPNVSAGAGQIHFDTSISSRFITTAGGNLKLLAGSGISQAYGSFLTIDTTKSGSPGGAVALSTANGSIDLPAGNIYASGSLNSAPSGTGYAGGIIDIKVAYGDVYLYTIETIGGTGGTGATGGIGGAGGKVAIELTDNSTPRTLGLWSINTRGGAGGAGSGYGGVGGAFDVAYYGGAGTGLALAFDAFSQDVMTDGGSSSTLQGVAGAIAIQSYYGSSLQIGRAGYGDEVEFAQTGVLPGSTLIRASGNLEILGNYYNAAGTTTLESLSGNVVFDPIAGSAPASVGQIRNISGNISVFADSGSIWTTRPLSSVGHELYSPSGSISLRARDDIGQAGFPIGIRENCGCSVHFLKGGGAGSVFLSTQFGFTLDEGYAATGDITLINTGGGLTLNTTFYGGALTSAYGGANIQAPSGSIHIISDSVPFFYGGGAYGQLIAGNAVTIQPYTAGTPISVDADATSNPTGLYFKPGTDFLDKSFAPNLVIGDRPGTNSTSNISIFYGSGSGVLTDSFAPNVQNIHFGAAYGFGQINLSSSSSIQWGQGDLFLDATGRIGINNSIQLTAVGAALNINTGLANPGDVTIGRFASSFGSVVLETNGGAINIGTVGAPAKSKTANFTYGGNGIDISYGASIRSYGGDIALYGRGNQSAAYAGASYGDFGVFIHDGGWVDARNAGTGGSITIAGSGGIANYGGNIGVALDSGIVQTDGAGAVSILGYGGLSSYLPFYGGNIGAGTRNGSAIKTQNGLLSIEGHGAYGDFDGSGVVLGGGAAGRDHIESFGGITITGYGNSVDSGDGVALANVDVSGYAGPSITITGYSSPIGDDKFGVLLTAIDTIPIGTATVVAAYGATAINITGFSSGTSTGISNVAGVEISIGAIVNSANGNISVSGTSGIGPRELGVSMGDWYGGLPVDIKSSGGNIQISGTSNGTLNNNAGILIADGTKIAAYGSLTLDGTSTGAVGISNIGVRIGDGASRDLLTSYGAMTITGFGTGGAYGDGVILQNVGLTTYGSGTITLAGYGSTNGFDQAGIDLSPLFYGGAPMIVAYGSGDVSLYGDGMSVTGGLTAGVFGTGGSMIASNTGHITITGRSGGYGGDNIGVRFMDWFGGGYGGATVRSIGGNIQINGDSFGASFGGVGINNKGVLIADGSAVQVGYGGQLVIDGFGGTGAYGHGIEISGATYGGLIRTTSYGDNALFSFFGDTAGDPTSKGIYLAYGSQIGFDTGLGSGILQADLLSNSSILLSGHVKVTADTTAGTLSLQASGGVSNGASPGFITAYGMEAVSTTADVQLNASNDVFEVAGSASGTFSLRSSFGMPNRITTVGATTGVTASYVDIRADSIELAAPVAGASGVRLEATGGLIAQSFSGAGIVSSGGVDVISVNPAYGVGYGGTLWIDNTATRVNWSTYGGTVDLAFYGSINTNLFNNPAYGGGGVPTTVRLHTTGSLFVDPDAFDNTYGGALSVSGDRVIASAANNIEFRASGSYGGGFIDASGVDLTAGASILMYGGATGLSTSTTYGTGNINLWAYGGSIGTINDATYGAIKVQPATGSLVFADANSGGVNIEQKTGDVFISAYDITVDPGHNFHLGALGGNLFVDVAAVVPASYGAYFSASGNIDQTPAGSITGGSNLFLKANGSIDFSYGGNQVASLTAQALGGNISFTNAYAGTMILGKPGVNAWQDVSASGSITLVNSGNIAAEAGKQLIATTSVNLSSSGSVSLDAVSANTLSVNAGTDVLLNGAINASLTGDAVLLRAGGNFHAYGGASMTTPAGRWLSFSSSPLNDTRGSLVYDFKQYNETFAEFQGSAGASLLALTTESGFAYSVAPVLTTSLTGSVSRTYDSGTIAPLIAGNLLVSGVIDGDSAPVSWASASYDNKNVGASKQVTANGLSLSVASNGLVDVYGYQLASTTAYGNIGDITPATISSVSGFTAGNKVYDSTTTATLSYGAAVFIGMYVGDVLTLSGASGSFADKNVGTAKTVNIAGITLAGADAINYTLALPTGSATADITPASISSVSSIAANDRDYDGSLVATLNTGAAVFNGMYGGDVLTVTGASGSFTDKNVGTAKTVNIAGIALAGADSGNYTLGLTTGSSTADITQLPSVSWIGGTGNWSNAANWAGGALPDASNVASILVLGGEAVTYDLGSATNLASLSSNGTLQVSGAGPLSVSGLLNTSDFIQAGGSVSAGNFAVTNSFSQSAGTLAVPGTATIQHTGNLSILNLTAGVTNLTATGNIGATLTGAPAILSGATSSGGNVNIVGVGGLTTTGPVSAFGSVSLAASSPLVVGGSVSAGSGITLSAASPDPMTINSALITSTGNIDATASGGAITMAPTGSMTASAGNVGLTAGGDITVGSISALNSVSLDSGGSVLSANAGTVNISANSLLVTASSNVDLLLNVVSADITAGGSITVTDVKTLTTITTDPTIINQTQDIADQTEETVPTTQTELIEIVTATARTTTGSTDETIGGSTGSFGETSSSDSGGASGSASESKDSKDSKDAKDSDKEDEKKGKQNVKGKKKLAAC